MQPTDHSTAADEARLVAAMRAGDARAFDRFARDYLPGVLRFARARLAPDHELARDVAQSAICKAIQGLGSYRGDAPLAAWLRACCANEIAGHFRRLSRRPQEVPLEAASAEGQAYALPLSDLRPDPEADLLALEERDLVHLALDQLPAHYAAAVEWRYLEGLDVPTIAERLASTYKATESLLSRARAAFRGAFASLANPASAPGSSRGIES